MRKLCMALLLLGTIIILSSSQTDEPDGCGDGTSRKSGGPPSCYAGEPPLMTTCRTSGCHEDYAQNTGPALLRLYLGGADSVYTPGQEYTITVSLARTGITRGGFQIVALQDNNTTVSPGIFTLTDVARTQVIDAQHSHSGGCPTQNKTWIEHTANGIDQVSGDSIKWQYKWRAPASNVGTVTFYLSAIDANVDLDNTGDYVYALTKQIASATGTGVEAINNINLSIFPNPASDVLAVRTEHPADIAIVSVTGQIMLKQHVSAMNSIDISKLPSGVYFIYNRNRVLTRFVKQ